MSDQVRNQNVGFVMTRLIYVHPFPTVQLSRPRGIFLIQVSSYILVFSNFLLAFSLALFPVIRHLDQIICGSLALIWPEKLELLIFSGTGEPDWMIPWPGRVGVARMWRAAGCLGCLPQKAGHLATELSTAEIQYHTPGEGYKKYTRRRRDKVCI